MKTRAYARLYHTPIGPRDSDNLITLRTGIHEMMLSQQMCTPAPGEKRYYAERVRRMADAGVDISKLGD